MFRKNNLNPEIKSNFIKLTFSFESSNIVGLRNLLWKLSRYHEISENLDELHKDRRTNNIDSSIDGN